MDDVEDAGSLVVRDALVGTPVRPLLAPLLDGAVDPVPDAVGEGTDEAHAAPANTRTAARPAAIEDERVTLSL